MPDAGTHYPGIETAGLDPRKDGVLTIQYVGLERGTGRPPSEIASSRSGSEARRGFWSASSGIRP